MVATFETSAGLYSVGLLVIHSTQNKYNEPALNMHLRLESNLSIKFEGIIKLEVLLGDVYVYAIFNLVDTFF